MITVDELEICRTPNELREIIESMNSRIMVSEDEICKAREKKGVYRWYRDEIMPLADFACEFFDDNVKIKPISGNQGYDAEVFDKNNKLIHRVELCVPHDGKYDFKQAQKINSTGVGDQWWGSPGYEVDQLRDVVVRAARNKSQNDYSDCLLAIIIKCHPITEEFRHKYLNVLDGLYEELSCFEYNAKEVYLFCDSVRYIKKLKNQ